MCFEGRARDIVTTTIDQPLTLLAEDGYIATVSPERTIVSIESLPARDSLVQLVGERGGGHLREVLRKVMSDEIAAASPLYLILDDLSGTSLIAGWAWTQWESGWIEQMKIDSQQHIQKMEGVCIGFRPGSSALQPNQLIELETGPSAHCPDLRNPDDADGWHAFTRQDHYTGMRRARRIDMWRDQQIMIDTAFQDSASTPQGSRTVLHEYQLTATADPDTLRITSIAAQPRVLPFPECTSAPGHLDKLLNVPLSELREQVLARFRRTAGCTHLNDALRALADVPTLLSQLKI